MDVTRKNAIVARLIEQGASLGTIDALVAEVRNLEAATIASYLSRTADIVDGGERPTFGDQPIRFDLEDVPATTLRRIAAQVAR